MKTVIGFNGSPRVTGNTSRLVQAILAGAQAAGAKTRLVHLARLDMGGCTACMACRQQAACSQPDDMGRVVQDILHADAVVLGSPVYMWQVSGQTKMFMDRLYPLLNPDFSTRLVRRPRLALAFTQGHPDESFFWPGRRREAGRDAGACPRGRCRPGLRPCRRGLSRRDPGGPGSGRPG